MAKLKLTVDSYEQRLSDDEYKRDVATKHYVRGDTIEPRNTEEKDRLLEIGAAEDPGAEQKRAQEDLDRRQAALDAQRAALDAEAKQVKADAKPEGDPAPGVKKEELQAEADARGLSAEGTKAELVERIQVHDAAASE